MTTFDAPTANRSSPSARISNVLLHGLDGLVALRNARRTYKALSGLSDHELFDIGLSRADIERVAYHR